MKEYDELSVRIVYRDRELQPTYTKTYSIGEYADAMRMDLQGLIGDIETLGYIANDNKPKEEWSDESFAVFSRIKHKLLDKAGEIGRLPSNLIMRHTEPMSEYVARILDGEEDA